MEKKTYRVLVGTGSSSDHIRIHSHKVEVVRLGNQFLMTFKDEDDNIVGEYLGYGYNEE